MFSSLVRIELVLFELLMASWTLHHTRKSCVAIWIQFADLFMLFQISLVGEGLLTEGARQFGHRQVRIELADFLVIEERLSVAEKVMAVLTN